MVIAKIEVDIGRTSITLYSRGRVWGLVITTDRSKAGRFENEQEAREWIEMIFENAADWTYEEVVS